jgi:acetyltransferase-like isoleucine patch superfamily enzyme/coenzyme F420-reducing hydrogenase beta subunit
MPEKYDIGIFGLWYGRNYGSMLTYFALNNVLKELGYKVAMIYNPLGSPQVDYDSLPKSHPLLLAGEYYNVTPFCPLSQMHTLNKLCDSFMVGSDQLWNYHLSRSYKQTYFLDFAADDRIKIAYGTSFGSEKYNGPDGEKPLVSKNLSRLTAVSVRDDYSLEIAKNEFNLADAVKVIDPVFLCDPKYFDELSEKSEIKSEDPYILAYFLNPNELIGQALTNVAKISNVKIYVILDEPPQKFSDSVQALNLDGKSDVEILQNVSVKEFLWLFKNADFVYTDSFHGTCFSIIYRKQFLTLRNAFRAPMRFANLMQPLSLLNRLTHKEMYIESFDRSLTINYTEVYNEIARHSVFSLEWLKKSLFSDVENKKNSVIICSKNDCTGCSACYNVCPVNAVSMQDDCEGFLYPFIDDKKCIKCGKCQKVCPINSPSARNQQNEPPKEVYAAYSLDKDTRFMSTSGGAFSEICRAVLEQGGKCFGAAYEKNFSLSHIGIKDNDGLEMIRQSKYYQSAIGDIFKAVKADLDRGVLTLFCGTPCQCEGLANFLGKNYENLILVDFICHSVSSPKVFREYLRELEEKHGGKATRVWFKNKENGWHNFSQRVDFDNGKSYLTPWGRDDFFLGFLKYKVFQRPSCHQCRFKEWHRSSDLTVGDFWGLNWNDPNNGDNQEQGVSVVMLRSEKAVRLFAEKVKSRVYSEPHRLEEVTPKNGGLIRSNTPGQFRSFFWENFGKMPYSELIALLNKKEKELQAVTAEPQITGKLTKIGNCVINMKPGSKIIIKGELVLNSHLPEGSSKECVIILHENAKLIVNGRFNIAYDSVVQLFQNATLTLGNGFINAGATLAIKFNSSIGNGFLCGRHFAMHDSDFHRIINVGDRQHINRPKAFKVVIGDHVWCGEGVRIMKDVNIGSGSIIGAGALVTKSVPENSLAVGVPAKVIKSNVTWGN